MPTPDARHRHEKARPQRVAARRRIHHLARLHEITPRSREIPTSGPSPGEIARDHPEIARDSVPTSRAHHLGKGDVGLGGVGGRGARVAKAAVGVVGPPDDDVAAALARDGVYGACSQQQP